MTESRRQVSGGPAATALHRPQTDEQWAAWHAQRDLARRHIARIRSRNTAADQEAITQALGLDPDAEADLINRWT